MKKKYGIIMIFLCIIMESNGQWSKQNSPTSNNLKAVAFADARTGFAVGDNGTVLKTTDGGANWLLLSGPAKTDIVSVVVADSLTVFVGTAVNGGEANIFRSTDGGISWKRILTDLSPFCITGTKNGKLFSVSRNIYQSNNLGNTWLTRKPVNSTSYYFDISFAGNNTGMAAGNISGILTYSADFLRTFDGGEHWYAPDQFKFPNANGFTAMSSMSPDSVFMFTNFYKRFEEGDSSQLILLTHFRLRTFHGDSSIVFKNDIVVRSFPDKIRDCRFFTTGRAYAAGDKGVIYISDNGGRQWKPDHAGHTGIKGIFMFDENFGIAIGDKGLILKRKATTTGRMQKAVSPYPLIAREE